MKFLIIMISLFFISCEDAAQEEILSNLNKEDTEITEEPNTQNEIVNNQQEDESQRPFVIDDIYGTYQSDCFTNENNATVASNFQKVKAIVRDNNIEFIVEDYANSGNSCTQLSFVTRHIIDYQYDIYDDELNSDVTIYVNFNELETYYTRHIQTPNNSPMHSCGGNDLYVEYEANGCEFDKNQSGNFTIKVNSGQVSIYVNRDNLHFASYHDIDFFKVN